MTRKEAIANLNMISVAFVEPVTKEQRELIDDTFYMAIKALDQLTSYEQTINKLTGAIAEQKSLKQEPCVDVISRQAVIDLVVANHTELNGLNVVMYAPFYKDIIQLPPIKPQEPKTIHSSTYGGVSWGGTYKPQEPKTGHWSHDGSHWKNRFICSECGYKLFDEPTNYCPNCGAKMESEVSE